MNKSIGEREVNAMSTDGIDENWVKCKIYRIDKDIGFTDNRVIFSALDEGRTLAADNV